LQFGLVTLTLIGLLLGAMVTQLRTKGDRHRHNARRDPLTGLGNRALLADELTTGPRSTATGSHTSRRSGSCGSTAPST